MCKDCGLLGPEIDELIEQVRDSDLSPPEATQVWVNVTDPEATGLCKPCMIAVIEAVG